MFLNIHFLPHTMTSSASNIDGRARTPRYIQNQLQALHSALLQNVSEIHQAIASSSQVTPAEVGIEYYLALSVVKEQYASIDFDQMLEEEYRIANRKDAADRRVAHGIVYIVPSNHTLFYSTIAPLSVAIAAGNCVALEVSFPKIVFEKLVLIHRS
jgi:acyl-CoA reductase-like NAD-dependent aldehyde dehydrogenase